MEQVLTVFCDTAVVTGNDMNLWSICTFELFAANGVEELCNHDEIRTDFFLLNAPTCIDNETIIGVIKFDGCYDEFFIEHLYQRLKGLRREGKELNVLKTRYNVLLPVSTANL